MKTLKKYEFKDAGASSTYDWDTILGGQPVMLEAGKDFECKTATFLTLARNAGQKRGLKIRTAQVDEHGKPAEGDGATGVVVQAFPASPEEIAKWEAQAEDRKEKAKERRAEKKAEAPSTETATA